MSGRHNIENNDLSLRFKLWLDRGGKAFGLGPLKLLRLVRDRGSLRQAAAEMSMSYNKAWHLLRDLESRLGFSLVERSVGGASGGGSRLTKEAEELVDAYGALYEEAEVLLGDLFARHFGRFGSPPG